MASGNKYSLRTSILMDEKKFSKEPSMNWTKAMLLEYIVDLKKKYDKVLSKLAQYGEDDLVSKLEGYKIVNEDLRHQLTIEKSKNERIEGIYEGKVRYQRKLKRSFQRKYENLKAKLEKPKKSDEDDDEIQTFRMPQRIEDVDEDRNPFISFSSSEDLDEIPSTGEDDDKIFYHQYPTNDERKKQVEIMKRTLDKERKSNEQAKASLRRENRKNKRAISKLNGRVTNLSNENENLRINVAELSTENKTLKLQVAELSTENKTLKLQVAELSTENKTLKLQVADLSTENKTLKLQVGELSTENKTLKLQVAKNEETILKLQKWMTDNMGYKEKTNEKDGKTNE